MSLQRHLTTPDFRGQEPARLKRYVSRVLSRAGVSFFSISHRPHPCRLPFSLFSHHLHAGSTPWPLPSFGGVSPGRQSRQMHIRSLLCCANGDKFADTVNPRSSYTGRGVSDTMVG